MNEKNPLFLTIDFGTQSVRVAFFDKSGEEVAIEKQKYDPPYFSSQPNYAEQDPSLYYDAMCEATKRITAAHPELLSRTVGVTVTCFRDSAVMLDKDMNVIRPSILWLDQRNATPKKKLPLRHRILFRLVGMSNTVNYNRARSMANWIREYEPENWARCHKYVGVSTYMIYRLTGRLADTASSMAGHYPIDFKKRQWYKRPMKHFKGQVFAIEKEMLPELVPEGSEFGKISEKAAQETGIPSSFTLFACGSDKSCETLGVGVLDDRTAAISYGTASGIETTRRKYTESERFLPGYPSCVPGYYQMDVQVYRGYWMINWFIKEFTGNKDIGDMLSLTSTEKLDEKLPTVPPGCDGLVLQPYWGPSLARPLAKGAIIGFSDSITQEHFYRSIIEGIAYALREGLEHFERKIHHKIKAIRVSGGGAQSDRVCQITADIMGRPVTKVQTCETSSLGAAISGFLAVKEFESAEKAVEAMVHPTITFEPNLEDHEKYNFLFTFAYKRMFPRLKGIYRNIKYFNRKEERELMKKKRKR